jgi:hypothetical protein
MGRPRELTEAEKAELIAKGYKPVEVWVLDWDNPEVIARIKRECEAINQSDRRSGESERLDEIAADLWDDLPE